MGTIYLSSFIKGTDGMQTYLYIKILCSRESKTTLKDSIFKFNIYS